MSNETSTNFSPPADNPPPQSPTQQSSRISNSTKLLVGGSLFFVLSALITRRSLARRRLATIPPYYTSATNHKPPVNGAMEALEALNIATINVASLAMIGVGGAMHAFDINGMDDLRRKIRGGLGVDGTGRSEKEVEEELEEWVVSVLNRKTEKEKKAGTDAPVVWIFDVPSVLVVCSATSLAIRYLSTPDAKGCDIGP
ncbi:hypothetical protein CIHG_06477 [Coccidioides immitis H538.4]|uniref:Altered inheritance of mitochondria protein 11 n=3 Tax=Coccidioides immitis TaxID=5501 RepID=A0A0J8QW82_COCIT|nr:hypothetical protein CIRG_10290 [Coccidioides immitis RMSCC 2394]KMU76736.1 hypothetical protein CISG_05879 [Coccidioides immitis RMSCC 3703]KMU88809.1 hypothetical protein CIHG_06477 [Coccidioides immitis H538.4]